MEKESLIQALRERIGENDFAAISSRSVETIIEPLLPLFADDDKVTEQTYELPVALLRSFIGQSRHAIAESVKAERERLEGEKAQAVKDAVEAYRASHEGGAVKDKPADTPSQGADTVDVDALVERKFTDMVASLTGADGAIGKLTKSLDTFINDYNATREREREDGVRTRVREALENLGADNATVLDIALGGVDFKQDKSFEELLASAKGGYESLYKKLYANGPQPFAGAPGETGSDRQFEDFISRRKEESERQAKDAEVLRGKMI